MKKTIADTITNKINNGEVRMRSLFSIGAEQYGIKGGIAILVGMLFLSTGFIIYWMNSNNDLLFGGYGRYGISSFIQSFPYYFLLLFIILLGFLTFLFRKFDFSYKKPLSLILILVVISVITLGWISVKQPIGQRFYQQEGRILRMGMMNNSNAVSGVVIEINKDIITIQGENNTLIKLQCTTSTHYPFGSPKVGDQVRSVGTWDSDTFNALGVRVYDESNPSTLGPGMRQGRGQGQGMMKNR